MEETKIDISALKDLLGKASPGMAFYDERNERLKNILRANASELLDKAEKWDKVSEGLKLGELEEIMSKAELTERYWLALEKLSYKGKDGWTADDCAEYAAEIMKNPLSSPAPRNPTGTTRQSQGGKNEEDE